MKESIAVALRMGRGEFMYPGIGRVLLTVKRNATRFTARDKYDHTALTVPDRCNADDVARALGSMASRLQQIASERLVFTEGQTLDFDGLSIHIKRQSLQPDSILVSRTPPHADIAVGSAIDMASHQAAAYISGAMRRVAEAVAPEILLPAARRRAADLGLLVMGWDIGRGTHVLGRCSADGIITLSAVCVFLPAHLRDYIICHELAHLSEMNHSANFHTICDRYLEGRERQCIAELKQFRWPIIR